MLRLVRIEMTDAVSFGVCPVISDVPAREKIFRSASIAV